MVSLNAFLAQRESYQDPTQLDRGQVLGHVLGLVNNTAVDATRQLILFDLGKLLRATKARDESEYKEMKDAMTWSPSKILRAERFFDFCSKYRGAVGIGQVLHFCRERSIIDALEAAIERQ